MNAIKWQRITNPMNIWRRLRKLRRELRETQRRVAELERIIADWTADS